MKLIENSGKAEMQAIYNQEFPTLLLECLKPGSDFCSLILEILNLIIEKGSVSSFSGENPLDAAFEVGIGNFWSIGKWCSETGDLKVLLLWYKVLAELLASTIIIPDLNAAAEASAIGLVVGYNADVLHAAWSCMIRFCSAERLISCPSFFALLLESCSLIGVSSGQTEQGSSLFLHEGALFVFLNCLKNVFLNGWASLSSESRAILLRTVERDVIQVFQRLCVATIICIVRLSLFVRSDVRD